MTKFDGDIFAGASIRPDGETGAWDDSRVSVTRIEILNYVYWFTPDYKWNENGDDFWVVIKRFGFTLRGAAGTKMGTGRATFTSKQAESARRRLIEYYTGPEDKMVVPFTMRRVHFLGVIFDDRWILVAN